MNNENALPSDNFDKRAAILDSTLQLLSERGLHDTPMSMISQVSGVSTGNIYHYFASKDELIVVLYREIKNKAFQSLLAGYNEDSSYKERFLYLWKGFIDFYLKHPKEINFLEQYENSPYYDANWPAAYSEQVKTIMMLFKMGVREKVLKDLPVEILVVMSTAAGVALAKECIKGKINMTEELLDAAANASWDAIKR